MRVLIIITILTSLFQSCERDTCDLETKNWKDDAAGVLAEFKTVNDEIKKNYESFDKGEFGKGQLFIRWDDSDKIPNKYGVELPKLKAWFKGKNWGYISYKRDIIEVNYMECSS